MQLGVSFAPYSCNLRAGDGARSPNKTVIFELGLRERTSRTTFARDVSAGAAGSHSRTTFKLRFFSKTHEIALCALLFHLRAGAALHT